jgi:hypothetical protein
VMPSCLKRNGTALGPTHLPETVSKQPLFIKFVGSAHPQFSHPSAVRSSLLADSRRRARVANCCSTAGGLRFPYPVSSAPPPTQRPPAGFFSSQISPFCFLFFHKFFKCHGVLASHAGLDRVLWKYRLQVGCAEPDLGFPGVGRLDFGGVSSQWFWAVLGFRRGPDLSCFWNLSEIFCGEFLVTHVVPPLVLGIGHFRCCGCAPLLLRARCPVIIKTNSSMFLESCIYTGHKFNRPLYVILAGEL